MRILFCLNRQKYPDFVHFVSDELETIRCCICSKYLERDHITIPNLCAHFTCPECACELSRMWKNDGKNKKRCPMCRVNLLKIISQKLVFVTCQNRMLHPFLTGCPQV